MQSELRKKLLEAFTAAGDSFVSGQKLSELLGCTRTAVWKHMEELRKEGYELEAVRRKGYRIMQTPDKIGVNEILLGLHTKTLGTAIHYEETVTSTQKIAHKLANEGAQEGTLIVAEEQTFGRGRLNRSWHSPKGTGIWMSLILRPNIPPLKAPQLTLLTAVAVLQGIRDATGLAVEIKWPNDLLIGGKKVVGILTEMQAESDHIHSVIIGIGINVNQELLNFPEELREKATSLAIEAGEPINRAKIIQSILSKFEMLYHEYLQSGFQVVKLLWESYAISIGRRIVAHSVHNSIEGIARGITEDGVLILEDDFSQIHYIHSADIELK